MTHAPDLIALLPPLAIFFHRPPATATAARILRLPRPTRHRSTTTARDTALAIAVAAFPDRPLIAVALVIGPLLEIPVLTLLTQLVRIRPPHTTSSPR